MTIGEESWVEFVNAIAALRTRIGKIQALHVNSIATRQEAQELAQAYFRRARPHLREVGLEEQELIDLDADLQELLRLGSGRSLRASYVRVLRQTRRHLVGLSPTYETAFARRLSPLVAGPSLTVLEARIIATLEQLVPSAALSYRQAISDLATQDRLSFRGTANELREALRDVVDHLAPDRNVMSATGFKLEPGQSGPTQKQKVRYILKSRDLSSGAIGAPEATVTLIDDHVASVTRASSQRSSAAAHISTSRSEVSQIKQYVDAVLGELLEIHPH